MGSLDPVPTIARLVDGMEAPMADLWMVVATVAFFALSFALVRWFDKI